MNRARIQPRERLDGPAAPGGMADRLGTRVVNTLSRTGPVTVAPWGTSAGWWTDVLAEADGVEVLARYDGGTYLDGRPAVVRNGNLVYAGFSDRASWLALLTDITGATAIPEHEERFARGERVWIIDHEALSVTSTVNRWPSPSDPGAPMGVR